MALCVKSHLGVEGMEIRAMRPEEIAMAVDWAAGEGWNPGHQDATCFANVDPHGFLIGEVDGAPAAIISNVKYDDDFAFLGFYIVRPDLRGRGHGWKIWRAGIDYAGSRVIGLDGVVAQQDSYRKSGFKLAYRNIRYGGVVPAISPAPSTVPLSDMSLAALADDDATVFPARRPHFLKSWTSAPGHLARGTMRGGRLASWGVIRPCRNGFKIGPFVADDAQTAENLFVALVAAVGGGEIFIDVPQPNRDAVALAERHGLVPVFETARMYTGAIRDLRLERLYGVTTFELG
jgi:GNAT superfamily N-acetyltransferase